MVSAGSQCVDRRGSMLLLFSLTLSLPLSLQLFSSSLMLCACPASSSGIGAGSQAAVCSSGCRRSRFYLLSPALPYSRFHSLTPSSIVLSTCLHRDTLQTLSLTPSWFSLLFSLSLCK